MRHFKALPNGCTEFINPTVDELKAEIEQIAAKISAIQIILEDGNTSISELEAFIPKEMAAKIFAVLLVTLESTPHKNIKERILYDVTSTALQELRKFHTWNFLDKKIVTIQDALEWVIDLDDTEAERISRTAVVVEAVEAISLLYQTETGGQNENHNNH